jgi:hypothetical protein
MVAVLEAPVFAATEKLTVPFPFPLAPPVIVTQEELGLSVAVQGQLLGAVTAKLLVSAAAVKVLLVGLRL